MSTEKKMNKKWGREEEYEFRWKHSEKNKASCFIIFKILATDMRSVFILEVKTYDRQTWPDASSKECILSKGLMSKFASAQIGPIEENF